MKLVILTRYYPLHSHAGGMETHAKNVAEFLARDGHEVHVVTTRRDDGSAGIQEENGVQIHLTDSWIKFGVFGNWWWKSLNEIRKIHQESPIDCVVCEGTSGYAYLASSLSQQVPCAYIAHGDVWNEIKSKVYRLPEPKALFGIIKLLLFFVIETLLLRRVAVLVAITPAVEKEFRRLYPFLAKKIKLIPNNGVDTARFRPLPSKENVYQTFPELAKNSDFLTGISVGRVIKEKGIHVLLQAMEHLKSEPFRVVIVGDGEYLAEAKQFVEERGLHTSVLFLGRVPYEDVPLLYSAADIGIFPSVRRAEGQPFVLVESMACGVPSICSDVRGFHEVIQQSSVGWLVPPNNVEALVGAIRTVLTNRETLPDLRQQAVKIAQEQFDMRKNIEQLSTIILETKHGN